ncbi:MAG TPA: hypothetical protein VN868_08550 [Terriglobales bacterium]|nr:hypothetical protein [Terriglobales bacterium]
MDHALKSMNPELDRYIHTGEAGANRMLSRRATASKTSAGLGSRK